jgi:hypothetical protein
MYGEKNELELTNQQLLSSFSLFILCSPELTNQLSFCVFYNADALLRAGSVMKLWWVGKMSLETGAGTGMSYCDKP